VALITARAAKAKAETFNKILKEMG
jgi:hypothetical protein